MSDDKSKGEFSQQDNFLYRLMPDGKRVRIGIAIMFHPDVTIPEREDVIQSVKEAVDYRIFKS